MFRVMLTGLLIALAGISQAASVGNDDVLRHMGAGKQAFDRGDWSIAGEHFDQAISGIDAVYGPEAARARELFRAEAQKPFKGENYERAMVFYYRGLLDLNAGDFENARASFESGLLQDSLSLNEDFAQDFASLEYLSGWASRCAGSMQLAQESFARAAALNPALKAPASSARTLVIGEAGFGPVKYASQEEASELRYTRHPDSGDDYHLRLGNTLLAPVESLYYQSVSRGPRAADMIATGKLGVKKSSRSLAKGAQQTAGFLAALAPSTGMAAPAVLAAAAGSLGVAMVSGKVSGEVTAAADTRQWQDLPGTLFLATSHQSIRDLRKGLGVAYGGAMMSATGRVQVLLEQPGCQVARVRNTASAAGDYATLQATLNHRQFPLMQ